MNESSPMVSSAKPCSGMEAFVNTRQHPEAKRHVGNGQNCANCHLGGGMAANSAPHVGRLGIYPKYRGKNDHVNTMDERIRGCFTYSMNAGSSEAGGPPKPDSQLLERHAVIHVLDGQGAPSAKTCPGAAIAVSISRRTVTPSPAGSPSTRPSAPSVTPRTAAASSPPTAKQIFPPCGEKAFNWGAGMHRINTAAGFIKYNMPWARPTRGEARRPLRSGRRGTCPLI